MARTWGCDRVAVGAVWLSVCGLLNDPVAVTVEQTQEVEKLRKQLSEANTELGAAKARIVELLKASAVASAAYVLVC